MRRRRSSSRSRSAADAREVRSSRLIASASQARSGLERIRSSVSSCSTELMYCEMNFLALGCRSERATAYRALHVARPLQTGLMADSFPNEEAEPLRLPRDRRLRSDDHRLRTENRRTVCAL